MQWTRFNTIGNLDNTENMQRCINGVYMAEFGKTTDVPPSYFTNGEARKNLPDAFQVKTKVRYDDYMDCFNFKKEFSWKSDLGRQIIASFKDRGMATTLGVTQTNWLFPTYNARWLLPEQGNERSYLGKELLRKKIIHVINEPLIIGTRKQKVRFLSFEGTPLPMYGVQTSENAELVCRYVLSHLVGGITHLDYFLGFLQFVYPKPETFDELRIVLLYLQELNRNENYNKPIHTTQKLPLDMTQSELESAKNSSREGGLRFLFFLRDQLRKEKDLKPYTACVLRWLNGYVEGLPDPRIDNRLDRNVVKL